MNLKTLKYITFLVTFFLTFLCHFMYKLFPNILTSIFFPVNESIWEHMKLLYTSIIMGGLIEYIIIKKKEIEANNIFLALYIKAIISIPLFLIIYLPLYYLFRENVFLNISVMIVALILAEAISYYILKAKEIKFESALSILFIVITYLIFSILTFYPPKNELFYDKEENKYGINNYEI